MEQGPLVSVIVPVFKVEDYVEQCARSVLGQTYPFLECIFVNDGSPDRSVDVIRRVAAEFPQRRVLILEQENAGLPLARKRGIEQARGAFIQHVDADDWLELDAVERLVKEAVRTGADLVYCDFWKEYGNRSKLDQERHFSAQNKERWMKRLYTSDAYGYVWCKFARRELYEDIFYPRYAMHEDIIFSTQLIWRAGHIAQLDVPLVHYRRDNAGSVSRAKRSIRRVQSARNMADLCVNGGPEVAVVRKQLIRKAAWNAFRYDRSLFEAYPFLRREAPFILKLSGV